jgi:hypothetical protein
MGFLFNTACAALVVAWLAAPPPVEGPVRTFHDSLLIIGGKCLDLSEAAAARPPHLEIQDCRGGQSQRWTLRADGAIHSALAFNKCLDLPTLHLAAPTRVELRDCTGDVNQEWSYEYDNTIHGPGDKCWELPGGSLTNRTRIELGGCHGRWNQQFVAVPRLGGP